MKRIAVFLATLMILALSIGIYLYENQNPIYYPKPTNPIETVEPAEQEPESFEPLTDEAISYTLQNDELNITYNGGADWINVPIDKELLFHGEYHGNGTELIEDSYILTENIAAFIYGEETNQEYVEKVLLKYSYDRGETWQDGVIAEALSGVRFRKVDFLNESFGYVVLSGGRTMSQEFSIVYLTHDGGATWEATAEPPTTRLIAFGSFIDEQTGFLSYGTINPEIPDVFVTQDGGKSWKQAQFNMPPEYVRVFVQAEDPEKHEDYLTVLLNQGPNGDYEGGKVKGEFRSEDNGLTWEFFREVQPDEQG
ncbi:oxidoreductase [Pseudogracilibacillus sp. SE30717A]|uniref:WD40/YVTN/BNR-like repeat-containing protein n=1 Tax=Pseudogracilibacillus sp. SE30717A TaxID=3098293 RepID=UPI00300DDF26